MLKEKAAKFVVRLKLRKSNFSQQTFSEILNKAVTFLILMPEDEGDFKHAVDVIDFLVQLKKEVTILTYDYRVSLLPLKLRSKTIEHGIKDLNNIDLPNKNLIHRLDRKNFDAILDLNRNEQLFYSYVAVMVDAKIRIGFKNNIADRVYNLQIANNETNPKISYKNLLNCLKML